MSTKTTSTVASELIPSNGNRKSLAILNEDSTDSVYIKRERGELATVSSTDHDWKIGPGGSIAFNSTIDGVQGIQARYTAIASANTPRVSILESEDIVR